MAHTLQNVSFKTVRSTWPRTCGCLTGSVGTIGPQLCHRYTRQQREGADRGELRSQDGGPGVRPLASDPPHEGKSGGSPRDLEDPATRVEDLRCGVDYLTMLDSVDAERIGIVGAAQAGYEVNAGMTEHRIKAVGTVTAVNLGRAFRQADTSSADAVAATLKAVGAQRAAEARGAEQRRDPLLPDTAESAEAIGITDRDMLEAVEFYRTPRGYSERSTNRLLFTSNATILGFGADSMS
jgi:fermentation-respiration switch protein FrsA (DUF1100 family)